MEIKETTAVEKSVNIAVLVQNGKMQQMLRTHAQHDHHKYSRDGQRIISMREERLDYVPFVHKRLSGDVPRGR